MTTTTCALVDKTKYLNGRSSIGLQVSTESRQQKFNTTAKQHQNILKELSITESDLTEEDITLYAKQIGIDPSSEPDLLWIARKGLTSRLPFPWIAVEDQRGRLYYFNCRTETSCWEHPSDPFYRSLAEQQRLKGSSTTLSMSGLTSIANLHFVDEDLGFRTDANLNKQVNKNSSQIDNKNNNKVINNLLKSNNNSDEEVESVDFELEVEEELEDLSSNDADIDELHTIDVTEGGINDVKEFKEIESIPLSDNVMSNELKYRIDSNHKSKTDESVVKSSEQQMRDEMQNISVDSSSSPKAIHTTNAKQSTGSSTGGKNQTNNVRHNEVSVDEFLLNVSEDPFAEFDGYDQNYNDLFESLGAGMSSKYDNSDNYEQTSAKPLSNSNQSTTQALNKTHKPLETLLEATEKDENPSESIGAISAGEVDIDEELVVDEDEGEEDVSEGQHNENDNNINELNEQQIEYKFEEMTNTLTQKITSLRNELREEIRKQRNTINKEIKSDVNDMSDRINRNTSALSDTKSQIMDLREIISKSLNQMHTSPQSVSGKAVDRDRIENEMQLLRSDVRNESLDAIRELRNELNREMKSKVNTVFNEFDNKFTDFKDESTRDMRAIRTELSNVSNNSKNFGQQSNDLRNDLSETVADIERHRKEYNKRLEQMDSSLAEETQRFQTEVERLQTLLKKIEKRVNELETESNEIHLSSRLDQNDVKNKECLERVEEIDRQVRDLAQKLLEAFKSGDNTNKIDVKSDNKSNNVVVNEPKHNVINRDTGAEQLTQPQTNGVVDEESEPIDIYQRMSAMEANIKKICDSFQGLNGKVYKNRNTFNRKQEKNNSHKSRHKVRHQYSSEDEYTSSTSLLSSSSVSEPRFIRHELEGKRRKEWLNKRAVYHSMPQSMSHPMPHRSKYHKTDIHSSHKCCIHKDSDYYLPERDYHMLKVPPLVSTHSSKWQQKESDIKHIRSSSSSLLNLIKKTTKKLREEAIELEGLGNYRFITDIDSIQVKDITDPDCDEAVIKNLKTVRLDVDQKLRKLSNILNQQKSSEI